MKRSCIRAAAVWSIFVFLMILALAGWASEVLALDDETTSQSLMGLQGISVMPHINLDPERDGLKIDIMRSDVELKLRKAGIKVITESERMTIRDFPYLEVNVNAVKGKDSELYTYDINTELYRQEVLNPDEVEESNGVMGFAIIAPIKIWSSKLTGTVPGNDLKNSVGKNVSDLVDKFIHAYLAANPKKS